MPAASNGEILLKAIGAHGRPTGSTAEQAARDLCARELTSAGFTVGERAFEYSAFPGLWGTSIVGLLLALTALWVALRARSGSLGTGDVFGTALALCAIGVFGWWLGRYGITSLPVMRRRGMNLEGVRGVPKVWLVAHLDTKRQPISLLIRAAGVVVTLVAWLAIFAILAFLPNGARSHWIVALGWIAAAGALPLVLSWVHHTGGGTGALDNASGVATVLRAATLARRDMSLGVLLTSAEELGMAGARGWLAQRADGERGVAINCDGVDDHGQLTCTIARDGGVLRSALALLADGRMRTGPVRVRGSMPGVLFDSVAFAEAGWPACTLSRGTLGSLARVHTRSDTLDRVGGVSVEETARVIAALAGSIIAVEYRGDTAAEEQQQNGSTGD